MPLDVLKTNAECQKVKKKHWKIKCSRIESRENSQETSLCTGKKPGYWQMFPLPNPKIANEPWHMLVSVIAPGHHLPRPSRRTPESLKPQKMGRSVAIFPKKNYDNLMDVGWISVQARASIGCLDMFGLSDSATR